MFRKLLIIPLIGVLASPAAADDPDGNPGLGRTLEFYALTTDVAAEVSSPPQAGERVLFARDLYRLGGTDENPEPIGAPVGRNLVLCTIASFPEASCEGRWLLYGRGLITGAAYLDLTVPDLGFPRASLTGGSGEFHGARGAIATWPAGDGQDQVWVIDITGHGHR